MKKTSDLRPGLYEKRHLYLGRMWSECRKLERVTRYDGRRQVEYTCPGPSKRESEHRYVCTVADWRKWADGAVYL